MGFTHYWRNNDGINQHDWSIIAEECKALIAASPVTLWRDYDEPDTLPFVNGEQVCFNGAGDDGHETFLLSRKETGFDFCKTNRAPYNLVVCACLAVAAPYLSSVGSDGDLDDEWVKPLAWASNVLGRRVTIELK